MNKEEYIQFHNMLAKLKYELETEMMEAHDVEYIRELRKQIDAIDEVMKIFIFECE